MCPDFIAKTTGFLFLIAGVTALLGAFVQINPIWLYGPYVPYKVSYAVQPDWYMGWLDGALRIMPSWEIHLPGHMIPNAFFPAILLPGITFNVLLALADHRGQAHRGPRRAPAPRPTAGPADPHRHRGGASSPSTSCSSARARPTCWRTTSSISLNFVLSAFRVLCFVVPAIVFPVTYKICKELQEAPTAGKRKRREHRAALG